MNLTGKELVDQCIVTGLFTDNNIQQHGVDLNLIKVEKVDGIYVEGIVYNDEAPKDVKTRLAQRWPIELYEDQIGKYWYLEAGVYDITFSQGCKVPADKMLLIRQRSSLLRNGTILHSSVFDAGFKTDNIGTVMIVNTPIKIYYNARVAQIYAHNSNTVQNLYNGQWQNDNQRAPIVPVTEDEKLMRP